MSRRLKLNNNHPSNDQTAEIVLGFQVCHQRAEGLRALREITSLIMGADLKLILWAILLSGDATNASAMTLRVGTSADSPLIKFQQHSP